MVIIMEKTIGEKVRDLREDMDLTQTELGEKLQMTQRKISYIECNVYEPNIYDIISFCKFFNLSADYFLGLPEGLPFPER